MVFTAKATRKTGGKMNRKKMQIFWDVRKSATYICDSCLKDLKEALGLC
jgi:hypothetical protein